MFKLTDDIDLNNSSGMVNGDPAAWPRGQAPDLKKNKIQSRIDVFSYLEYLNGKGETQGGFLLHKFPKRSVEIVAQTHIGEHAMQFVCVLKTAHMLMNVYY